MTLRPGAGVARRGASVLARRVVQCLFIMPAGCMRLWSAAAAVCHSGRPLFFSRVRRLALSFWFAGRFGDVLSFVTFVVLFLVWVVKCHWHAWEPT